MTLTTFGDLHYMEEYRRCRCNMCGAEFSEADILVDEDEQEKEHCPGCHETGCLMDIGGGDE